MKGIAMKKFVVGMAILAMCLGLIEVEDGKITKCRHCGKEIGNTVQKLNVARKTQASTKSSTTWRLAPCARTWRLRITSITFVLNVSLNTKRTR